VNLAHGISKQIATVGIFILGIAIGIKIAQIGKAGGTQQGIRYRMQDDISITVTDQALAVLDIDPRNNQRRPSTRR
jgi:hypothetical protein